MDSVVFRPGRLDGTGEGEDVFAVQAVVGGGRGGVPRGAMFDGISGVLAEEAGAEGELDSRVVLLSAVP